LLIPFWVRVFWAIEGIVDHPIFAQVLPSERVNCSRTTLVNSVDYSIWCGHFCLFVRVDLYFSLSIDFYKSLVVVLNEHIRQK
jgi:hypothetical protein